MHSPRKFKVTASLRTEQHIKPKQTDFLLFPPGPLPVRGFLAATGGTVRFHLPPGLLVGPREQRQPRLQVLTQKAQWPLSFTPPGQGSSPRHACFWYKHLHLRCHISSLPPVKDRLLVCRDLELLPASAARNTESLMCRASVGGGFSSNGPPGGCFIKPWLHPPPAAPL